MECLHGKAAASTTTNNGTFWFCGEKPSCEFFRQDENCYMYTRAVAAFRASGSIHPVCPWAYGRHLVGGRGGTV